MKKHPNPKPNLPKEVKEYICQQAKFQKDYDRFAKQHTKQINDLKKCHVSLDERFKKQEMERRRITKELSIANQMIKKQQKEINRLQRDLGNFLS